MQTYEHLNSKPERLESDWDTMFFQRMHSARAFANSLTANVVLTVEKMLGSAGKQIRQIKQYKKF